MSILDGGSTDESTEGGFMEEEGFVDERSTEGGFMDEGSGDEGSLSSSTGCFRGISSCFGSMMPT